MPVFSPYLLRANDPAELERARRAAAGPVRGVIDRSGKPLPEFPPPPKVVAPAARVAAPTVASNPVAPSVVATRTGAPPLTARERGAELRGIIGREATRTGTAVGQIAQLGTLPARKVLGGLADAGRGAVDFGRGLITGERTAPPPRVAPAQPDVPRFTTGDFAGQPIPSAAGFQRARATTPALPPSAAAAVPAAPALTQPRGLVGPPQSQQQPYLDLPPEGSVQVIRGTQVSTDRGGLSIPRGLEGEPGRLAAGFRNLGLSGDEIPPAIVAAQGAASDRLQAEGYVKQANAAMLNAGKPEFSEVQVAIPGRRDVNKVVIVKKNVDGTIDLEDTDLEVRADINKTTQTLQRKDKDIYGKETIVQFMVDAQGNYIGDLPPDNRRRPPEIPQEDATDFDAAMEYALQAGESEEQATQTAMQVIAKKRARRQQEE